MIKPTQNHLKVDKHFYFFTTYLAARMAGLKTPVARQLAAICQSMSELAIGCDGTAPWYYREHKFVPIVTGAGVSGDDLGVYNCELAFHRMPALEKGFQPSTAMVASAVDSKDRSAAATNIKHVYHPLTDIDWKGGGRFKSSFSRKIAARETHFQQKRQAITAQTSQDSMDARLQSSANSRLCRTMINDTIYRSRYCDRVGRIDLALLGCRLFVYQNAWLAKIPQKSQASRADGLVYQSLGAFYWSVYAIECFLKGKTMEEKLRLSRHSESNLLEDTLRALYGSQSDSLETEFLWLERLPGLLASCGLYDEDAHLPWWQGFRYRQGELLESAMVQSGAGLSRNIQLFDGFKSSDFYKLNKAAEYHTHWLSDQLAGQGLSFYDTRQSCGDSDYWQI